MLRLLNNTLLFLMLFFINTHTSISAQSGWQPINKVIHKSNSDYRKYQAVRLDNSMTVLLISDKNAIKSLAAIAIPVGSLEDPHNQLGMAHYLEHMIFMGSSNYPEPNDLSEFLKKHGGNHNASTTSYRTAFYLEVENNTLQLAMDYLADAIATPKLSFAYADKERYAIDAELRMAQTNDAIRMAQIRSETMNLDHPASRFSGGNLETLSNKPGSTLQNELKLFHQRYYSANLMVSVIYSNQSLNNMAKMAACTFGRIKNRNTSVPLITAPAFTKEQIGTLINYQPAQPYKGLRIEFPITNNSKDFRKKIDTYISYLICNRSKGTLADWLQQEGLADDIKADYDLMINRNGGIFVISVTLSDKGYRERDRVASAIFAYLSLLKNNGIQSRYFKEMAQILDQDFRFPAITRNMDYIEWLADSMLRAPLSYVVNADYIADDYDPSAIAYRLDYMVPNNAQVWFISPDAPHNKTAYFLNAPYKIDKLTESQIALWKRLQSSIQLSLPALNPYIADDFSIINTAHHPKQLETLIDEVGLRLHYTPSLCCKTEPRADITINFRNSNYMNNARKQILYSLNDRLSSLTLTTLSYQAYIGGINFSFYEDDGLTIQANGYTQKLIALINKLLNLYMTKDPTTTQLSQAKIWYRQQLNSTNKQSSYYQATIPADVISIIPYVEPNKLNEILDTITLKEVIEYRKKLIKQAAIEILIVGNITPEQSKTFSRSLKTKLGTTSTNWKRNEKIVINKQLKAIIKKRTENTDSALAASYVPTGYGSIEGIAYSYLLTQIIESWFYDQLRSKEQLGYAVSLFPIFIGDKAGISFVLQSGRYQPAYLYQRYKIFFEETKKKLNTINLYDFQQYKQSVIAAINQKPHTLSEEVKLYNTDLDQNNTRFNTRNQIITYLQTITKENIIKYYQKAVIEQQGFSLLSEISGISLTSDNVNYANPHGWITFPNESALQHALLAAQ